MKGRWTVPGKNDNLSLNCFNTGSISQILRADVEKNVQMQGLRTKLKVNHWINTQNERVYLSFITDDLIMFVWRPQHCSDRSKWFPAEKNITPYTRWWHLSRFSIYLVNTMINHRCDRCLHILADPLMNLFWWLTILLQDWLTVPLQDCNGTVNHQNKCVNGFAWMCTPWSERRLASG